MIKQRKNEQAKGMSKHFLVEDAKPFHVIWDLLSYC